MPVRRFDYVALNHLSDPSTSTSININLFPPPPPPPPQTLHRRHSADLALNSTSKDNNISNNSFPVLDEGKFIINKSPPYDSDRSIDNRGLFYHDDKAISRFERKSLYPSGNSVNLTESWKPSYNYADKEVECEKPGFSLVDEHRKPAYLSTENYRKQQAYRSHEYEYQNAQEYRESGQAGAHNYRETCHTGAIGPQNCKELGSTGAPDFEQTNLPFCPAMELSVSVNEQRKQVFGSLDQSGLNDDNGLRIGNTHLIENHGLHRVNAPWFGDRSSTGSNSLVGGRMHCTSSAGLQRQSSESSHSDSFLSGDLPLPTLSPSISINANDSALFNVLYEEGCKYDDPEDRHSSDSVKSWVRQTEESYNLQLTLALRLTAEAALTEDFYFLGNNSQAGPDIPSVDFVKKSKILSHRFWVNGSMSYFDKIEDGFYHIWGMNPHIWTICNNLEEGHQMPSLESLKFVDASDSSMEVILIDKKGDSYLRELVNKAIGLAYGSSNSRQMVEELGKLVCMLMGGAYLAEHGDLMMRWKASSKMLRDCLNSIILPIGSLSVGLCRHRALLFKTLADMIDLPCQIVRGCKYCGMTDGSSCLVQCDSEREYLVDLIGKPGALSDPMLFASGSTFLSIASPLRMPEFKSFNIAEDVRSLASQYSHGSKSLNDLLEVATSLQVAGPVEDSSGVVIASTSEQVNNETMVSSPVACTGTRPITTMEGPDATTFTGNKPVQKMPISDEKLKGEVDEIQTANKFALASDINGIKPPKSSDLSAAVGVGNSNLQREAHIETIDSQRVPVIAKSSDEHLQYRRLQVTMKEDMIAKTVVQNFCENDKFLVEPRQLASAECPLETELPSHMHWDLQSMLKVSHNIGDDGAHNQTVVTPQNRLNLDLSLAMHSLEIPWEDLVLKERIGSGSFGIVHHADWHGSDVAVKILIDQDLHEERLKEFQREVVIMAWLRHPNVVLFMGAVTKRPNLSIVTEYLPRGSLYRLIHRSGAKELLDERRRLRMALDVAKGINYLHRLKPPVVHRDLKSPNLLVDKTWTVKVCDFGLSRFKAHTFISSKTAAGTPEWMAPEVLRDEPSNEKSDVYSFGVILWELVTMQQPWSGLSPAQVVGAVGFQNRRLTIPQDMHPEIASIVESCWANDSRKRPTFSSILESLKPLVKSPSVQPLHGGNS